MQPMSLLEQRRLRRAFRGFPVYEDGELAGIVNEPEIDMDDLPVGEQEALGAHIIAALREADERRSSGQSMLSDDRIYGMVLDEHGIRCPHPMPMRDYRRPAGYECRACGCLVVPAALARR